MRENLLRILELARWAPSGDNTQPWKFEILNDTTIRVYGSDTRSEILYDFDGHASHIAHGALLETMRIAASGFGLNCRWTINSSDGDREPVYDVFFSKKEDLVPHPLFPCIQNRTVQRRPMRTIALMPHQSQALIDAAGPDFSVLLFQSTTDRLKIAKLLWHSARIRLTCPEAYLVHRDIIEWRARYSKDRIPEQAVGVDPLTARVMEWVMKSWPRVLFFNRYLMGTVMPRIQLDLLPAMLCASHILVKPKVRLDKLEHWITLGAAIQRLWLTATFHGLHLQPEMTPVIFRWYFRSGRSFSATPEVNAGAADVTKRFEALAGAKDSEDFGFLCRVGVSNTPKSRSWRKDLKSLMRRIPRN